MNMFKLDDWKIFTMYYLPHVSGSNFLVTQMLMHDLFAVANLVVSKYHL